MKARHRRAAAALLAGAAAARGAVAQPVSPPSPPSSATSGWSLPTPQTIGWLGDALRDQLSWLPPVHGLRLQPSLSISETVTDNVDGGPNARAGLITQLSTGLGLVYSGPRARALLDYRLSHYLYLGGDRGNEFSNDLAAALQANFFDRRLNVGADASIRRAALSAFGTQPTGGGTPGANDTELRSLNVRSSWRSLLPSRMEFAASAAFGIDDAKGTSLGDARRLSVNARLGSDRESRLGWELLGDISRESRPSQSAPRSARARAGVTAVLPQQDLRLWANAGVESTNVASSSGSGTYGGIGSFDTATGPTVTRTIWGVGGSWRPSPRTYATAQWDRRAYGDTWSVLGEYRTALSFARVNFSRGIGGLDTPALQGIDAGGVATGGTLIGLLDAQLAGRVPDAAQRLQRIGAFLRDHRLDPSGGFDVAALSRTLTIDRTMEFVVGTQRGRTGATLAVRDAVQRRLPGALVGLFDDFALTSQIHTIATTATLTHRLGEALSANAAITLQRSSGDTATLRQRQQSLDLQLNGSAGVGAWSLGGRTTHVDSIAGDYFVNAVTATLSWRF